MACTIARHIRQVLAATGILAGDDHHNPRQSEHETDRDHRDCDEKQQHDDDRHADDQVCPTALHQLDEIRQTAFSIVHDS